MKVLEMAGNHRSGRKRKPLEHHLAAGTYRAHRHGPLLQNGNGVPNRHRYPKGETEPERPEAVMEMVYMPNEDNKPAVEMYEHLRELLAPVVQPSDTPLLCMACELWSLYLAALEKAQADPTDKLARTALVGYAAGFERIVTKFGCTPADR